MKIGLGIGLINKSTTGGAILPIANAATSITGTSFTANWDAFTGAIYYALDVSTSVDFSTFVLQNQIVFGTSFSVIDLTPCTTYYYRVRAYINHVEYELAFDNPLNSGYYSTYFY